MGSPQHLQQLVVDWYSHWPVSEPIKNVFHVSHAVDLVVVHKLFAVGEVVPPLEQGSISDEAESGSDEELSSTDLLQHILTPETSNH